MTPQTTPPDDPVAVRDLRRFVNYCRWSAYLGIVLLGLAAGLGVTLLLADGMGLHDRPLVLAMGVAWVTVILFTSTAIVVCELLFRGEAVPAALGWVFAVTGAALFAASPLMTPPEGVYEDGAGRWLGSAVWALGAAVVALSPRFPLRRLMLGIVVTSAVLLVAYLARGHSLMSASLLGGGALAYGVVFAPVGTLTWWMVDVVRRLDRSRGVAAQLAVAEERLRFSRDLHDVFGRTLSNVAVKSELAAELSRRGDPRAVDEMLAVREVAQSSLTEVRSLVRGYRQVVFADELAGARSVLRSAGIVTRVDGADTLVDGVTPEAAEALAWVVRESVTNVLRHAQATRVEIRGWQVEGEARLRVSNDVGHRSRTATAPGTGLLGLAERVEMVGGRFVAEEHRGEYVVEASVPLAGAGLPTAGPAARRHTLATDDTP